MSTKNELRDQVLAEMNARRIDHKTYINSEWLLSEYEKALDAEIDTNTMSTKTDEEIVEEFFTTEDEYGYSIDVAASGGDLNNKQYTRELLTSKLRTLLAPLRKEQEEAVIKAFKEGQEDGAVNRGERRRIIEQLRTEVQEESYTKGYNAGLADGTGKPLLAIEQIREEAVAEAVKAERERIREAFKSECQKNLKEYGGAFVSYEFEPKYLTSQNTKTDSPQNYWDTHTVDGVIESIETLKKGIPDTTNSDKRDEDQHREQCEGRY